ncbi:hypothetical protein ACHAPU_008071 [Fusarium lateritium]
MRDPISLLLLGGLGLLTTSLPIWYYYPWHETPNGYTSSQAGIQIMPDSPIGRLCHAHERIAQLTLVTPDHTPTLFEILKLDINKAPFAPRDDGLYPTSKNYKAVRAAIIEAWEEFSAQGDGEADTAQEWRNTAAVVTMTLLRDDSRVVYLREFLPKLKAGGNAWREFCHRKKD